MNTKERRVKKVTRTVIATHHKAWQNGEWAVAYFLVCGKRLVQDQHGYRVTEDKPLYFRRDQVLDWDVHARWVNGKICFDDNWMDRPGGEDLPMVMQLKDLTFYLVFGKELEIAKEGLIPKPDETLFHVFREERDLDGPNPDAMIPYKLRRINPTQILCFQVEAIPEQDAFWFNIALPEQKRMEALLQRFVRWLQGNPDPKTYFHDKDLTQSEEDLSESSCHQWQWSEILKACRIENKDFLKALVDQCMEPDLVQHLTAQQEQALFANVPIGHQVRFKRHCLEINIK